MSDDMISRTRARSVRLACQTATAVLLAGGAVLAFVGAPFLTPPKVEPVSDEQVIEKARRIAAELKSSKATEELETLPPDWDAIDESLAMVKNAPQPKPEPEADPDKPEANGAPETDGGGRTRFIGTISIGKRTLALLSAGGRQRVMGPGDKAVLALAPGDQGDAPEVEVKKVSADAVVLVENGVERRVERAPRTGFAVSHGAMPTASSGSGGAGPAGGSKTKPGGAFSGDDLEEAIAAADRPLNPDNFRREDGTIDYEALRKAARARAKARQALRQKQRGENDGN